MEVNNSSVYIVGIGACTALGADATSTAAAVRAGIAGFAEHPFIADTEGDPVVVAKAPYIPDEMKGLERFLRLAVPSAQEALAPLLNISRKMPPVFINTGLPAYRPGLPEGIENALQEMFGVLIKEACTISGIEFLQTGHASGAAAVEGACEKIKNADAECCLVGGVDSYIEAETLGWLESCEQLHGAGEFKNAWGFIPGEASGFCLLASGKAVKECSLTPFGEITAVSTALEKNLIKTETICLGEGMTGAFRMAFKKLALKGVPLSDAIINHVICDLNGEPYRADEFGYTMTRFNRYFLEPSDFLTPADCWGDVGAASMPLFISLAVSAWRKGYAKGPYIFLCSSSECGERGVAIIRDTNDSLQPAAGQLFPLHL